MSDTNVHRVVGNLLVGTSHFFVDTTTNQVGVNTSTPGAALDVQGGGVKVGSGITLANDGTITATGFSGNGSGLTGVNSDSGSWVNGSSSNIHLAVSTDNVGIGTVDPGNSLHIYKAAAEGTSGLFIEKASGGAGTTAALFFGVNAPGENPGVAKAAIFYERNLVNGRGDIKFCNDEVNDANAVTTETVDTRMIIKNNGNVGVGTNDPDGTLEISSTRTGLTALTNNEATLMISCTDTNAADDGDIGGGVVFRQRWVNSSSSLVPTGGIYGYKDRNSGSYGGGLIFSYCPNNGSPDNLVEAMRITKEGSLRLTGDANHPIKKTAATASTATYNYILNCERPGTTSGGAVHFINGSGRGDDGGVSTYTMRNDSGNTRVGRSPYTTIIAGAHSFPDRPIAVVGKNNLTSAGQGSGVFVFNTALINSGIYNYSNGRFTAPSGYGGYYLLSFTGLGALYNTNAPNTRWYVNGSVHNYGAYHTNLGGMSGTPAHVGISGMHILNLAAGHFVDLRIVGGTLYGQSTLHAYAVCLYLGAA